MKVLIADKFDEGGIRKLEDIGCDVTFDPDLKDDALTASIQSVDCNVLVVRSTKVTEEHLHASDALSLIVRAGAGYNTIDVETASKRSILVANCPGKNAIAVAELTMGLLIAIDRRIAENVNDIKAGTWNKKLYSKADGLKGKTMGIIGMGQIGQAVAKRAQSFDMNIAAWSRSLTPEFADDHRYTYCETPLDVAKMSDVISVHLAATADTKHIINEEFLSQLKPGAYIINTARHDVMDYDALKKYISEKNLRVGVDVFPNEPSTGTGDVSDPIFETDGVVYGTHHIGASTEQSQRAIANETIRIIQHYYESGQVVNCVNHTASSRANAVLVIRHINRPGVLADALRAISMSGINVEEMQNIICDGGHSACARIELNNSLDNNTLQEIRSGEFVIGVTQT